MRCSAGRGGQKGGKRGNGRGNGRDPVTTPSAAAALRARGPPAPIPPAHYITSLTLRTFAPTTHPYKHLFYLYIFTVSLSCESVLRKDDCRNTGGRSSELIEGSRM